MPPVFLLLALIGAGAYLFSRDQTGENTSLDAASNIVKDTMAKTAALFSTPHDDLIAQSEQANGLPPGVLWKLLYTESRFRPDIISGRVKSPVGALGIAQFMPATAVEQLGSVDAALDPSKAIPGAARYLRWLIDRTGSLDAGVAAYNWGVGNVQRKGLANAPRETVDYVAAITGTDITA